VSRICYVLSPGPVCRIMVGPLLELACLHKTTVAGLQAFGLQIATGCLRRMRNIVGACLEILCRHARMSNLYMPSNSVCCTRDAAHREEPIGRKVCPNKTTMILWIVLVARLFRCSIIICVVLVCDPKWAAFVSTKQNARKQCMSPIHPRRI